MQSGVFFGLTTVDIVSYVARYPGSNEKAKAGRQLYLAGGPPANAAITFRTLGNSSRLFSALGEHPLAVLAMRDLEQHGVEVVDLVSDRSLEPVFSAIIVDVTNGDRCVVYSDPLARSLNILAI